MLNKTFNLTTVTFDGSQTEGYMYPDNMYGNDLVCKITHHHKNDIDASITIQIGDNLLTPNDIEVIQALIERYREAAKAF